MRILLVAFIMFFSGNIIAQNYTRDAGIRLDGFFSATYRQFTNDDEAIEGMLFVGRHGMTFSVLKEHFQPAFYHLSEYLFFEYGYGAHAGFRYMDHYKILNRTIDLGEERVTPLLGIVGLIGLEYRIHEFPVIISVDYKPYFEYSTIQIFSLYLKSFGISLKYRF